MDAKTERRTPRVSHHEYLKEDLFVRKNESRTRIVLGLSAVTMVAELVFGYATGSMALLADGWHMASHAGALFISLVAYRLARAEVATSRFSFGAGKFIPLGGYTTAVVLAVVAILMGVESITRLLEPHPIRFVEAIWVTAIGLVVNVVSAVLLHEGAGKRGPSHSHEEEGTTHLDHAKHSHHHGGDSNLRSAYAHVLADALTSIFALFGLVAGKVVEAPWLDSVMGIVGSLVILRWAYGLCRDTAWELLDGHPKEIPLEELRRSVEDADTRVLDLHVWRIAPSANACEIVLSTSIRRGPDYYKAKIRHRFGIRHIIVEEVTATKS